MTGSLEDIEKADLIFIFGSNLSNNHPHLLTYLYKAKGRGAKIICVNPIIEPGLKRYRIPSKLPSLVIGTKIADHFVQVNSGGDIAFINGLIKFIIESGNFDREFIEAHTEKFLELKERMEEEDYHDLAQKAGIGLEEIKAMAQLYIRSKRTVFIYCMGLTQQVRGTDNVRAIAALALIRGNLGKEGCGVFPLRGHSNVQGACDVGTLAEFFPGYRRINAANARVMEDFYGAPIPSEKGKNLGEIISSTYEGNIKFLYLMGGNPLESSPDKQFSLKAMNNLEILIFQDIFFNQTVLQLEGPQILILPSQSRYEHGGTYTSTERKIRFSPKILIPPKETLPDWKILSLLGRILIKNGKSQFDYENVEEIMYEMGRIIPQYSKLREKGILERERWIQWGGKTLYKGGNFNRAGGRAKISYVNPLSSQVPRDGYVLISFRGIQLNTTVLGFDDGLHLGRKKVLHRRIVFMNAEDARGMGIEEGQEVVVRSEVGELVGEVQFIEIKKGHIGMYFPECNTLIKRDFDTQAGIPNYKRVIVKVEGKNGRRHKDQTTGKFDIKWFS